MHSCSNFTSYITVKSWRILPQYYHLLILPKNLNLQKKYYRKLDQLQTFLIPHFNLSLNELLKLYYPLLFHRNHIHLTILVSFLRTSYFRQLQLIRISTRISNGYIKGRLVYENGHHQQQRSYMSLLVQLYIQEYTKSLKLKCIKIQTLIRVLYTQFQTIYHYADSSRLKDIAIFHALKVILIRGITCLRIRFGSINQSLQHQLYKLLLKSTIHLLLKLVLISLQYGVLADQ